MTTIDHPTRCRICGYYLTTATEFIGSRCLDPGHWQAAGILASRDYYPMAKIASEVRAELNQRSGNGHSSHSNCY